MEIFSTDRRAGVLYAFLAGLLLLPIPLAVGTGWPWSVVFALVLGVVFAALQYWRPPFSNRARGGSGSKLVAQRDVVRARALESTPETWGL